MCRRAVAPGRSGRRQAPTRRPDRRFDGDALAAISRVFAREAALKVAEEGLRWVAGLERSGSRTWRRCWHDPATTRLSAAQTGLLADMNRVADVLYGRHVMRRSVRPRRRPTWATRVPRSTHDATPMADADRGRRRQRDHARRARRGRVLGQHQGRPLQHQRRAARTVGPGAVLRPRPDAPDKTYSKIGGWVRDFSWEPMAWKLPIPPRSPTQMDDGQQWAVAGTRAALLDAGWPDWNVDPDSVAVIIGNAIGGDKHYRTNLRIQFPEFAARSGGRPVVRGAARPRCATHDPRRDAHRVSSPTSSEITEDTMPGELANVIAGRVANLFNLRGPNFTTDAACASALAAISAAVDGLADHDFDAAITGGVDRNMDAAAFVKFCKIGALSATGTRPFDAGADGFVMGEGAALFVLKRLADAERDGDRIYAVILGIAGSSDGKGKGITAPNPIGQRLAVERAWRAAGARSRHRRHASRRTAPRPGSATPPSCESLTDVFGGPGRPQGRSRSVRSSPTSVTSRPRPAPRACSRRC